MLIKVIRFKGRLPDIAAEARFTRSGGTIGRNSQCTLPLPDPERQISRIQAEINWSGSEFTLTDRGNANPILRNGEPVGKGRSVPLLDGDELLCGDYVLRAEYGESRPTRPDTPSHSLDPFAQLVSGDDHSPQTEADHPLAAAKPADALIPDDFDPFGMSVLLPGMLGGKPSPSAAAGKTLRDEESIDALFGLGDPVGDPLSRDGILDGPASRPNTSRSGDPLASLQSKARKIDAAVPDHAPEIHNQFRLPTENTAAANMFRSWESNEGTATTSVESSSAGRRPSSEDTALNPQFHDAPSPGPRAGNDPAAPAPSSALLAA
ncbi:FHA domain-containing protein, partial [Noviherbaspirillum sp.]|uniref:FHA domain-containing protein n=1 Tax=Noviherbaspirillum sp. TaxID=1926288 RepID=UPI002FE04978